MSLISLNRLVFGLIATIVGIAFWVSAPREVTVAGDVSSYTSTWEIVDNLIATRNTTEDLSDQIIIGVAKWKVTGSFRSQSGEIGPFFKETWESPSDPPIFTRSSDGKNLTMTGGLTGNWIAGAIWPRNLANLHTITITKRRFDDTPNSIGNGGVGVKGNVASCRGNECIFATGAYGFTNYHEYTSASSGKDRTNGVAIPVRWTVTGTLCELPTATECQ